eukprot:7153347-Karenia_brevis.AAC.1
MKGLNLMLCYAMLASHIGMLACNFLIGHEPRAYASAPLGETVSDVDFSHLTCKNWHCLHAVHLAARDVRHARAR